MFKNATSYNQDLSGWNVSNVTNCTDFSDGATAWIDPKPTFTACTP
jgi:surface protein